MGKVYICADSLKPSDNSVEQGYSYGPGAVYGPVLVDPVGDGEQASLVPASNTRAVFVYGGAIYKLLNRQQTYGTVLCKSLDDGATWAVLDGANSPAFETCSGYFDGVQTVYCAFLNANAGAAADVNLRNFDLVTGTWGAVYGVAAAPHTPQTYSCLTVYKRPDDTLLVIYGDRNSFNPGDPSGIAGAVYDLLGGAWVTTFDLGANLLALPGWDATQTTGNRTQVSSVMDAAGVVHVFFTTASFQTVPVIWGNRCFYQAVLLNNSLGSFYDFPGQVAPLFLWNGITPKQDLEAYAGSPMGQPVIVGDMIVLPVLQINRSLADRYPTDLANVYIGTPVAAPVWSKDNTKTIDPGAIIDDFIWPQEAPAASFDGTTVYCVFPAQDADGQDYARLRLVQTANLASPADGWSGATAFDLQTDPSFPGFQFPTQKLTGASVLGQGSAPSPLSITCDNPPPATLGQPYSHVFPTTGGTPPLSFSMNRVPPGMFLDQATGELSGTAFLAGTTSFTIGVTDALGATDAVDCSVTAAPASVSLGGLRIWLYGVKRRKKTPPAELCGCPEPSHVKKAV